MMPKFRARAVIPLVGIVILAVGIAVLGMRFLPFLRVTGNWLTDFRIANLLPAETQHPDIVIAAITDDTLDIFPYRYPVDRLFLSHLLESLEKKSVRAILLDLPLDHPTEAGKDQRLQERLRQAGVPMVARYGHGPPGRPWRAERTAFQDRMLPPGIRALGDMVTDPYDGGVRWIFSGAALDDGARLDGLVVSLARKLGVSVPTEPQLIAWRGQPNPETPAFRSFPAHMVPILPEDWFRGKIVLVGRDLPWADRYRTPFTLLPKRSDSVRPGGETAGLFIHAHALAQILDRRPFPRPGAWGELLLNGVAALAGIVLARAGLPFTLNLLATFGVVALFWTGGFLLSQYSGFLIPLITPTMAYLLAFAMAAFHGERVAGRLKRKALAETRQKSEFLANMSHEIRTPMNAVIGMTELVLETALSDPQRKHLTTVLNSARALLHLLNEVLDFSKMESGRMVLEAIPFDLPRLLEETLETLGVSARVKGLALSGAVDPALPRGFVGDPARLRQVLMNLVGNAIKFTDSGFVAVTVKPDSAGRTGKGEGEGTWLVFSVKDSGCGIPEAQQQHIFESFTQADGSIARKHGGTGLGTTISKRIVETMGGTIRVESAEGQGSAFIFRIPLPAAPPGSLLLGASAPAGPQSGGGAAVAPLRILLAEDVEANITLAVLRLERQGHRVTVARDGQEALRAFKAALFDLVLMDVQMPLMDGFNATRAIRALELEQPDREPTPIIAMTANAMPGDRQRCLDVGMNDHVTKPIDFSLLNSRIAAMVPGAAAPSTAPAASEAPPDAAVDAGDALADLPGIHPGTALERWGDAAIFRQALAGFAGEHAGDGARLREAVRAADLEQVRAMAHALKGAAANLAADGLAAAAGALERAVKRGPEGSGKPNDLEPLLLALEHHLAALVIPFAAVVAPGNREGDGEGQEAVDDDPLETSLETLREALRQGDAIQGEAALRRLRAAAPERLPEALFEELLALMDDFEFEEALQRLPVHTDRVS